MESGLVWSEGTVQKVKGRDIGYAPVINSCEGANSVDACTVTASDVFTAFAVSAPAFFSQSLPVFSGQSVAANRFVQRSTQPTSEWRLLMEATLSAAGANQTLVMIQPTAPAREPKT